MNRTVLIIEDEHILREIMKDYFSDGGYNVLEACDGKEALSMFHDHEVDLVILDIMLPEIDGWSVCKRIRKISNVPIIILTARVDEEDTLLGFELGADDYVTKPYSPAILFARAKRLLERQTIQSPENDHLSSNSISVHIPSRSVSVDGTPINLTHTEFEILSYLMSNKGMIVTREQLINKIWGYDFVGDERTVNSHLRNLRHKLGSQAKCIVTVVRSGYKFEDQV